MQVLGGPTHLLIWGPRGTEIAKSTQSYHRATVKLSATFFHDESSITIGGYESAIAPIN